MYTNKKLLLPQDSLQTGMTAHRSVTSSVYSTVSDRRNDSPINSSFQASVRPTARVTSDWQPRLNSTAPSRDHLSYKNSHLVSESVISEHTALETELDPQPVVHPAPTLTATYHENQKAGTLGFTGAESSSSLLSAEDVAKLRMPAKQSMLGNLPQQSLSKKFKRLSMTLQQVTQSNGSQTFMSEFQNNIEKTREGNPSPKNRRSEYYNRLDSVQSHGSHTSHGSIGSESLKSDPGEAQTSMAALTVDDQDPRIHTQHSRTYSHLSINSEPSVSRDNQSISPRKSNSRNQPIASQSIRQNRNPLAVSGRHPEVNTPVEKKASAEPSGSNFESLAELIVQKDDDEYAALFICALYAFQSDSLQSASDASICLSFEKNDLAFVHTIDESGWGEVTLLETLQRGWIPMNYFTCAITPESDLFGPEIPLETPVIPHGAFLKPLFASCGQFLLDPLSRTNHLNQPTFSITVMNNIRDGVRILLQRTGCLSRSNDIVIQRPFVRKCRKSLLANWYQMMIKANEFRGTSTFRKIELLTLLVYQVVRQAVNFLELWSNESKSIMRQQNLKHIQNDRITYPLLDSPPFAQQRVTEINGMLYSYMALVMGRLDLIEFNTVGCNILESITHHIILLLRELLFISKSASEKCPEKATALDRSLDTVLSLVSAFVASVKNLVARSESGRSAGLSLIPEPIDRYLYTEEGGDLIQIASEMTHSIGKTVSSIRKLLLITGDFRLTFERAYPDYLQMRIGPSMFIEKCMESITLEAQNQNRQFSAPDSSSRYNRYSAIKQGNGSKLALTAGGSAIVRAATNRKTSRTTSFIANKEFDQFTTSVEGESPIENELLRDNRGNLIGASLRGLVYTLTDETQPPDYFYVSTFFTCVHTFASSTDLLEEFIARFDVEALSIAEDDTKLLMQLMSRRKLVVRMLLLWMELYWDYENDYPVLPALINFFNEGMSSILPIEAMNSIEIAARLCNNPQTENTIDQAIEDTQLVDRPIDRIKIPRPSSDVNFSLDSTLSPLDDDGFELARIHTTSSSASSAKSLTLPMPLGVGNQTASSGPLLSKSQLLTVEKIVATYRKILQNSWADPTDKDLIKSPSSALNKLLPKWFNLCDQSWVLSNYRPNLVNFNGLEMAKQLTLVESQIFCSIRPNELLRKNYTEKRARLNLAPNVQQSLLFTNCLSSYVLESILQPGITLKTRVNSIKTWLKIAISCLYLKNFNSLAAIVTSLQSHSLTRLVQVWDLLSEKYEELFAYLAGIIHPDKNYSVYRHKLRAILDLHDPHMPIVPYFSLFLLDLTFVMDGNSDFRTANTFLSQKLINIDKYSKLTRVIADLQSLQVKYPLNDDDHHNPDTLSLSDLAKLSSTGQGSYITPIACLQELILLELWKINQLNKTEQDRVWKLSCSIQPK